MKKIYKTIFLLILNSAFSIHNSFSQTAPGIEWQNTIGANDLDDLYSIQQTKDGGYILGGRSWSNISGDKTENCFGDGDYWIVKTDSTGNIQWQNTIGGNGNDLLYCIQQTTDGGYILGGLSYSNISGDKTENSNGYYDYWIVKTDSSGNIQWQNTIGGSSQEFLHSIQQTNDGGYILGGFSSSDISGDKTENNIGGIASYDYWIVKTDSMGNIQWENTIGGMGTDRVYSVQQTTDGGYILAGDSNSDISGDKTENSNGFDDYWMVKTNASGNIQWQNTIGGLYVDRLRSMEQTADGGYILGGYSDSDSSGDKTENRIGETDYWIVKTDASGNVQWENTIGGDTAEWLFSIHQTADGGYILGGWSFSNISVDKTENSLGNSDYWILKTDSIGNIQWDNTIGGSSADDLYCMEQTNDGGYILGGSSLSDISSDKTENCHGDYDLWVIKLARDTITSVTQLSQLPNYPITISPNPLTTQSKLTFKTPNKEKFLFTLYDITGRITENVSTINNEIILTKDSKRAGVYSFHLVNEKTGEKVNGKIVISN